MSLNPPICIPSAPDAEEALGLWVDGHPIEEALIVAAERAADGERDVARLAAAALWWVARERPLTDGNKRAALVFADLVLRANERHLGGPEEDLVQLAARTAAGVVDEQWVAEEVVRLAAPWTLEESLLDREPEVMRRLAEDDYELPVSPRNGSFIRLAWPQRLPRWRARTKGTAASGKPAARA